MLTFLHFTIGTLALLFVKEKSLKNFLIAGFIAIMPDFDLIFNWLGVDYWVFTHRGIMHSLLAVFIVTILVMQFTGSFWLGFWPYTSHMLLDIIDGFGGPVLVMLPGYWVTYPLDLNRYILSGVVGSAIILSWIVYVLYVERKDRKVNA